MPDLLQVLADRIAHVDPGPHRHPDVTVVEAVGDRRVELSLGLGGAIGRKRPRDRADSLLEAVPRDGPAALDELADLGDLFFLLLLRGRGLHGPGAADADLEVETVTEGGSLEAEIVARLVDVQEARHLDRRRERVPDPGAVEPARETLPHARPPAPLRFGTVPGRRVRVIVTHFFVSSLI